MYQYRKIQMTQGNMDPSTYWNLKYYQGGVSKQWKKEKTLKAELGHLESIRKT